MANRHQTLKNTECINKIFSTMWYWYAEIPLQNLTFQYMPTQRLNTEKDKDILTCLAQLINSTGTHQYITGTTLFPFKLGQPGQRCQLQPSISSLGYPKSTYWNKKTLSSLLQNSNGPSQWNWLVIQSLAGTSFHGVIQRSRFLLPVALFFCMSSKSRTFPGIMRRLSEASL